MAKMDNLMKSFEAFINNDTKAATQMFREFFIESAVEINKDLENKLNESFGGDPEADLEEEVVAEAFGEDEFGAGEDEGEPADEFGGDEFGEDEGEPADDFGGETDDAAPEGELPTPEQWANVNDKFDELEALFDELGGDDFGAEEEPAGDFGGNEFGAEDELQFGDDEELDESFQMKAVKDPGMGKETDADKGAKSCLAKQPKSPMGVKASDGWTKDGTVTGSNDKADYTDTETPKVEDQNNVMDNGKKAYKKHAEPNMKSEEAGVDKQSLQKTYR